MSSITALLISIFFSVFVHADVPAPVPVYGESADAALQVAQALSTAKPALKALLDARYVIVEVDVNRFNKNLDVVKPYGEVIKKGIPSIVIATPTNRLVYATNGGELADARKMGAAGVAAFFQKLANKKS